MERYKKIYILVLSKFSKRGGIMVISCNICSGEFKGSPDSIVLCDFKDGMVHLGCCINNCSMDKKPCKHAIAVYEKLE